MFDRLGAPQNHGFLGSCDFSHLQGVALAEHALVHLSPAALSSLVRQAQLHGAFEYHKDAAARCRYVCARLGP